MLTGNCTDDAEAVMYMLGNLKLMFRFSSAGAAGAFGDSMPAVCEFLRYVVERGDHFDCSYAGMASAAVALLGQLLDSTHR